MAKIEKFECVETNGNIEKASMTIVNENEEQMAEVYLAFIDNTTGKRYLMYTTDVKTEETEKITFSLTTFSLQGEKYVLEGTDNVDYNNIQLPVINIVGLNNQKTDDEIMNLIDEKFGKGNISIIDLRTLEKNISNIVISNIKPAKKANVPVVIANGIKRFYLARLNKLLKEVYSATEMTEEQADIVNSNLDKIDNKLEELNEIYESHDKTAAVEKSIEQIENARMDIEQAKNRINNLVTDSVEEEELEETSQIEVQDELEKIDENEKENLTTPEPQAELQTTEEVHTVEEEPVYEETEDPAMENSYSEEPVQAEEATINEEPVNIAEQINESINSVVQIIVNEELSASIDNAVHKIVSGISSIYEEEINQLKIKQDEEKKELLTKQINETQGLNGTLDKMTAKLQQINEQLKKEETKSSNLEEEKQTLLANNQELTKQNSELKETIASKDEQLGQQNSIIENFREEIKNTKESSNAREQELLSQIEQLKSENMILMAYKQKFDQIAPVFAGQTISQPVEQSNEPSMEAQVQEAIDYAMAPYAQTEEQSSKTL